MRVTFTPVELSDSREEKICRRFALHVSALGQDDFAGLFIRDAFVQLADADVGADMIEGRAGAAERTW